MVSGENLLRGSYTPLVVPFRNGNVDFDQYATLVDRQITEGTDGIVVNATSGEPTTLTRDERIKLVEVAIKASNGRRPICAGTAIESHADTCHLVEAYDKLGANSILVVTPYYIRPPQRAIVQYIADVAKRTEKPLLIYHIPQRAGVSLVAETVEAIADKVPHFAGIKNTDGSIDFITGVIQRLGSRCRIFAGAEEPAFATLALGGVGAMLTTANILPAKLSQLCRLMEEGRLPEARTLVYELLPLFRAVALDSPPIPSKYLVARMGWIRSDERRLPLIQPTDETARKLDDVLRHYQLI